VPLNLLSMGPTLSISAGDGHTKSLKGFKRGERESTVKFNQQEFLFGACAGSALYRGEMLEEIGSHDEDFFDSWGYGS
jgi:hypothetical protein